MSINDYLEKIKPFYTLILGLVIASIFFALGRISVLEDKHTPIKIEYPNQSQTGSFVNAVATSDSGNISASGTAGEAVIGSKSGKKYYFPWCSTVARIKPENQVHFASIAEAQSAGYVAGGNCKGLK